MTTTHTNPYGHGRPPIGGRPGRAVPDVAGELRRLTTRDRWIIDLLHQHQVLTTEHIAALAFDTVHTGRIRMTALARRGVLARFRDCPRPGSQSWRWTLGWVGAAYIAARDDKPTPRPSTITDQTNRLAASPRLAHLLGVNTFFVTLAAHARHHPDASLDRWWSERTTQRELTGDLARPDGHGIWTDNGHTVSFWLEYDTGTEPTHRVLDKLHGYIALHRALQVPHPVLIRMQTTRQETSLHRRLGDHPAITATGAGPELVVATMTSDHTTNPADAVWLPAGHDTRLPLARLPRPGAAP